jgi:hypothetical protein
MTPVTDSALLSKLNAPVPVTDPGILAQLNGPDGYAENVAEDWKNTQNKIGEIYANKDLNPASAGVQILGNAVGGAYAPVNEAVKSGYNALPTDVTQPINNTASAASEAVKGAYAQGVDKLANTDTGKAIGGYLMNSPHIQNGMQEVSDDAKAMGNILTMAKVKPALGEASEAAGNAVYQSGKAAQDAAHQSFVQDMVLPKKTPTVQADMALRTTQENGKNIYKPTPQETQVAATVSAIPGVSKSKSLQANLGIIKEANTAEADALKTKLKANDVAIPDDVIQGALVTIRNELPNATNISTPGEATIARVVNAGLDHITANPQTASGMLEARKAFDRQIIREKGEGILDPAIESPRSNAVAAVRQAMNKMVAEAVPSADVMTSLQKQNQMFTAMENIAPKAAGEAATRMGRIIQKASPHSFSAATGGLGLIGLGNIASHYIDVPPSAIGAGLVGAGAYKAARAPTTRIMLGKALGGGQ